MPEQTNAALLRFAEAITDESPVSWGESGGLYPDLAEEIAYLARLQSIAEVFRQTRDAEHVGADGLALVAAPPQAEEPLLFVWGKLRVRELLGAGTFGEVYRASDTMLGREVALKLKRPAGTDASASDRRFLDEARRVARVRHPNVQTVHGADIFDGRAGLWSDLVRGTTLEHQLQQQGPLSAAEAAIIGLDLCRALAAVHAAGLVHGDVKTTNVMRETGGRILLVDFGAGSEILPHGEDAIGLPSFGTPLTMAPEILEGASPHPGADIYALGVLMYRLVTGRYPVTAETLAELHDRLRTGDIAHLRDVRADLPAGFVHVVERAMVVDPAARYASAGSMERALASLTTTATFEGFGRARRGNWRSVRWKRVWIGVAALGILLAAGRVLIPVPTHYQLADASFESAVPLPGLAPVVGPFTAGFWGAEKATIVSVSSDGRTVPCAGEYMLEMRNEGGIVTQAVQAIDVTADSALVDMSRLSVSLSAMFNNSGDHEENLITQSFIEIESYRCRQCWDIPIGLKKIGSVHLDNDPTTWEPAELSRVLPAGTRWVLVEVGFGDKWLGARAGYVDDVTLKVERLPAKRRVN